MMYGWGGWLGGPFMIVFWILLIVGGVALVKWLFSLSRKDQAGLLSPPAQTQDRSLAILRERYAKGEISSQEYQAMRAELGS
ncbi:MAG: SHOCT domain-containing protein [Proteobacteria bacterium]|nr:SHOCT domain-containing protein [Pseudomonadota bacterium]MBU1451519.1 SHOCT domain-containing protein [Pseudomonadota bacterium]MBU2469110.1 SHOCT domain-containing protein [Pseudomonadota bacterium]MBU2518076.1 SHOCT domain-containing protein [Pseudomonadota bacterium]